jgi:outer membrane protein assembly factor BamB
MEGRAAGAIKVNNVPRSLRLQSAKDESSGGGTERAVWYDDMIAATRYTGPKTAQATPGSFSTRTRLMCRSLLSQTCSVFCFVALAWVAPTGAGDGLWPAAAAPPRGEMAVSAFAGPVQPFFVAAQRASRGRGRSTPTDHSWPQFRGPNGQGTSPNAAGLPVTWNVTQNVLWKTELPGAGSSSPIVVGDKVFLTSYSGYRVRGMPPGDMRQLTRHVVCLSASEGRILWKADLPAALPESESVREHGYAASTPACDGQRLYVFFGKSGVFAFDLEGKPLWRADVGVQTHGWGSAASPVLYQDLVLINACVESESLVALDARTGRERWRARGIRESWSTPLIVSHPSGRPELVLPILGKILGFDPATGTLLWSCNTDIGWYMAPSAVAHEGIVYALGGRSGVASLAVRTGGRGDVTSTHRLWTSTKGSNVSSPVFHEGHLYWTHDSLGIACCAEARTGKIVYEERLPRGGQFYASAVLADGKLYYVSRAGHIYVLAASPKYQLLAVNELSDRSTFDASPAVAGSRLYLRSDRFLYCVGSR